MSFKNVFILLFLSVLIFATVPSLTAQATPDRNVPQDLGVGPTAFDPEDIRQVQMMLRNRGYDPGDINGMLNTQTQDAIRQFQAANNLPVTGKIDQRTQMALGITVKGVEQGQPNSGPSAQNPDPVREKPSTKKEVTTDKVDKDAAERIQKAAEVLQDLTKAEDKRIPNGLLGRAEAIAVIPNMVKGAFGIGGRFGKGVVSKRLPDGRWSPPSFIEVGGGSFGLQLGVTSTDLVLVFTDAKAVDRLEKGTDLKLGADASVAAGPIGRSAEAGVNSTFDSAVYAYSRAKGLFAGVALDGAVLHIDEGTNKKVYGENVAAMEILGGRVRANPTVTPFLQTVERVVPKKRISQR